MSIKLNILTKGKVNIQFGIGSTSSIRFMWVIMLISKTKFYIVKVNTLFLLCFADMD